MELRPCPRTPNCACSRDAGSRAIRPLLHDARDEAAAEAMLRALRRLPRVEVRVLRASPLAVHALARSRLFGFVDDVEVVQVPGQGRFDVRSASRTGHWDLGVNRRRVERLRGLFREELARPEGSTT